MCTNFRTRKIVQQVGTEKSTALINKYYRLCENKYYGSSSENKYYGKKNGGVGTKNLSMLTIVFSEKHGENFAKAQTILASTMLINGGFCT